MSQTNVGRAARKAMRVVCYTVGAVAILAGLASVAQISSVWAEEGISEASAAAWITAALLCAVFGALMLIVGLISRPPQKKKAGDE